MIQLALEIGRRGASLQSRDRSRRIGAIAGQSSWQGLVRVAGMAAAGRRNGVQAGSIAGIALVIHQRERARQRRRPQIIRIPPHGIAAGVTRRN